MLDARSLQPRWGNEGRDRKGLAIWTLMHDRHGKGRVRGLWMDVGCGSGGIAAAIAPLVDQVIGVDPEAWPAWSEAAMLHRNLTFINGGFDGDCIPVTEATVDVLVCNQVYEHVGDPDRLVRNLARALKPGGLCYFAGPNLLWPVEPHVHWPFVHWLPRGLAQRMMRALGSRKAMELDAYSKPVWVLKRWFHEAGFEYENAIRSRVVVELSMRGHRRAAALAARCPRFVFDAFAAISPGFIFILRKKVA